MTAYGDAVYFWVWSNRGTRRSSGNSGGPTAPTRAPRWSSRSRPHGSRVTTPGSCHLTGTSTSARRTRPGARIPPAGLWRTDGTPDGTVKVKALSGPAIDIQHLTAVGSTLYFSTESTRTPGSTRARCWRSDGTTDGTVPVTTRQLDLRVTNVPAGIRRRHRSRDSRRRDVFVASDGTHGHELWRSDGSDAGTSMVADLRAGSADGRQGGRPCSATRSTSPAGTRRTGSSLGRATARRPAPRW